MPALRAFIADHRRLAVLLVAMALLVKALVPAGYMVGGNVKLLTVSICADSSGGVITKQLAIPMNEGSGHPAKSQGQDEGRCAFTALGLGALAAADIELLAEALLFILALGLVDRAPLPRAESSWLRPPLRGPPSLI